jgi:hypothetical protein
MEHTPDVLSVYAFLESRAVTLNHPADAKRKISVQTLLSELGLVIIT